MPLPVYFYRSSRGAREVRSFLRALPMKHRIKCIAYLKRIRDHGTNLPANIVKHLESGLWEARPEYGGIEYRFLFFVCDSSKVGVVSAFVKKRDKIERRVIETSLRRMEEMRSAWQEEENGKDAGLQNGGAAD